MTAGTLQGTWLPVRDADPRAFGLYMRHYSSKKGRARWPHKRWMRNGRRFVGSGEHIVLLALDGRAVFAWRKQELRDDDQYGVECSIFRNEGPLLSSGLIREADAIADQRWPGERHFTFIDENETRARRSKHHEAGHCFRMAGWRECGRTARGLVILERLP